MRIEEEADVVARRVLQVEVDRVLEKHHQDTPGQSQPGRQARIRRHCQSLPVLHRGPEHEVEDEHQHTRRCQDDHWLGNHCHDRPDRRAELDLHLERALAVLRREVLHLGLAFHLLPHEPLPADMARKRQHVRQAAHHEQDHRYPPSRPRYDIGKGQLGVDENVEESAPLIHRKCGGRSGAILGGSHNVSHYTPWDRPPACLPMAAARWPPLPYNPALASRLRHRYHDATVQ